LTVDGERIGNEDRFFFRRVSAPSRDVDDRVSKRVSKEKTR
jgi:hypothetical protein